MAPVPPVTWYQCKNQHGLIGAHRGYRARYPENTMAAFEASLGRCDFIEFDVQLTKDFIPVVMHDTTLIRTSDILTSSIYRTKGSTRLVDYSLSELKTLNIGDWFYQQDPFGTLSSLTTSTTKERKQIQSLLTLDELLHWATQNRILLNLEIKKPDLASHSELIVEKVMEKLYNHQYLRQVLISSFNHKYLIKCKKVDPSVQTAALVKKTPYRDHGKLISYLQDLEVLGYHPNTDHLELSLVRHLRSSGFMVNVYTVNCRERQQALFEAGAAAVITDFLEEK